jgi:hypothetical protein
MIVPPFPEFPSERGIWVFVYFAIVGAGTTALVGVGGVVAVIYFALKGTGVL